MIPLNVSTYVATQLVIRASGAEKRVLDALRERGALSPRSAAPLFAESKLEADRLASLLGRGIVVEAAPERYYVDAAALARHVEKQRRIRRICLSVVAAVALLGMLWVLVGSALG